MAAEILISRVRRYRPSQHLTPIELLCPSLKTTQDFEKAAEILISHERRKKSGGARLVAAACALASNARIARMAKSGISGKGGCAGCSLMICAASNARIARMAKSGISGKGGCAGCSLMICAASNASQEWQRVGSAAKVGVLGAL